MLLLIKGILMRLKVKLIVLLLLIFSTFDYATEYYKVNVKRIEQNLYKITSSNFYIVTQYCYEYTYGEDAILKYEANSYDNQLIFDSGTSCKVVKLLS